MTRMTKFDALALTAARELKRFSVDESGATAIEYAMIASGIGVAVVAAVYSLGSKVNTMFTTLAGMFP
jgi:pilus assembly protein Flp/PilA